MRTSEIAAPGLSAEAIASLIHLIRGQKVMIDADLARLYGVPTKALLQAVRRNAGRFPADFMFLLVRKEVTQLRSQIVTASRRNIRHRPAAFTEHGVAMLASVLNSERAVQVNIMVIRAFVRLRVLLASNRELTARLMELERKFDGHDEAIQNLFAAIRAMLADPSGPKRRIGFNRGADES